MYFAIFCIEDLVINENIHSLPYDRNLFSGIVAPEQDDNIYIYTFRKLIDICRIEDIIDKDCYFHWMSKPMYYFFEFTKGSDCSLTRTDLREMTLPWQVAGCQFVNLFSLACWFVKDCSVQCKESILVNPILNFRQRDRALIDVTNSRGRHSVTGFSGEEVKEALKWMKELLPHMSGDEIDVTDIEKSEWHNDVLDINSHIGDEGTLFNRALRRIEDARGNSFITAKMDRYCSALECLYCIEEKHKERISAITSKLLADVYDINDVKQDMRDAYGIRSDSSHGGEIKYLKSHSKEEMSELCFRVDNYVRHVFKSIIGNKFLNYGKGIGDKNNTKMFFLKLLD